MKPHSRKFKVIPGYRTPLQVCELLLSRDGIYYPICPRCKCSIDREYMSYCDRCGQRLGWDRLRAAKVVEPPIAR